MRDALKASGEPILPLTEHVLSFVNPKGLTVQDNWELNSRRDKYRVEYQALMKSQGVDVILCPTYAGVGVLQGQPKCWTYSSIWNVLDHPAAVFPSGLRVDKRVDTFDSDYKPRSAEDEREWKACE